MAFKISFIQASRYLTGVVSYTILETENIREIIRGHFASVLIAMHNGKEFVLKEIFCKHWDQKERNSEEISFGEIISKSALGIMNLVYRDLKLRNVFL